MFCVSLWIVYVQKFYEFFMRNYYVVWIYYRCYILLVCTIIMLLNRKGKIVILTIQYNYSDT